MTQQDLKDIQAALRILNNRNYCLAILSNERKDSMPFDIAKETLTAAERMLKSKL